MSEKVAASNYIPGLGSEFVITADEIDPAVLPDNDSGYLQANKVAYQAPSTASDVAGIVTDFNTLLSNMQSAGVMATA